MKLTLKKFLNLLVGGASEKLQLVCYCKVMEGASSEIRGKVVTLGTDKSAW